MWNKGKPLTFAKKWNPFNNDVPWTTYMSHPLLWRKGKQNKLKHCHCDVNGFKYLFMKLMYGWEGNI
jgi:hypothetical protein